MGSQHRQASSAEKRPRVLVVGDHALLRDGLVDLLRARQQFGEVGQASSYDEALEKAKKFGPDVILADAWLDHASGADLMALFETVVPKPKVIILSVHVSDQLLLEALKAGIRGLLDRSADATQVVECVLDVARNEIFISRNIVKRLILLLASGPYYDGGSDVVFESLTERERQILQRVAAGQTNKTVAGALYLSEGTVRAHMRSILRKLNVANRVQAATLAFQRGLSSPPDGLASSELGDKE